VVIRAEKVLVGKQHEETPDATVFDATVDAVDYQGVAARYFLTAGPLSFQAINPIEGHPFAEGDQVQLRIRAAHCVLLKKGA
jgi:putative spermidine/putrescine transport system ATP-binding protein/spermidine/putrescine transport system ATP-binding protein